MNTLKGSALLLLVMLQAFLFSCNREHELLNEVKENDNQEPRVEKKKLGRVASGDPIILGYFPSWSESWPSNGCSKMREIPPHVTHVFLGFAKPNLRYVKGSYDITGTGIEVPYDGVMLKETVQILRDKGTRIILSIGGETYWGTNDAYDINYQHIKDLVDDMGFEGIDWDFEPNGSFSGIGYPENVQRMIDFFNESRAIMPEGEYLLACAPAGVGALGGQFNDDPASPFAYSKRNQVTGEDDTNLWNATSPNEAISV